MEDKNKLTDQEILFCDLYVNGEHLMAVMQQGAMQKCLTINQSGRKASPLVC